MFSPERKNELQVLMLNLCRKAHDINTLDFNRYFFGQDHQDSAFDVRCSPYASDIQLQIRNSGNIFATVLLTGIEEGKLGFKVILNGINNTTFVEYDWSTCLVAMAPVRLLVQEMFNVIKKMYRNDVVPSGCVKAYLSSSKALWVMKRSTSDKIAKINDDYYLVIGGVESEFICIRRSETDFDWALGLVTPVIDNCSYIRRLNGEREYWYQSALVPVYSPSVPFSEIVLYTVLDDASSQYECVIVDGIQRFVNIRRELEEQQLFQTPIHSYSTRIETVVKPEQLFLKGRHDLYKGRDNDITPFLGWELEACSNLSSLPRNKIATTFKEQLPGMIFCKIDGSINPEGFETVSVPATLDAWRESGLTDALNVMKSKPYSMRSYEHSSCGFHVHVSRAALSVLDLQKMERFMHNPDNREFLGEIAGRGSVAFASFNDGLFNDRKIPTIRARGSEATLQEGVNWLIPIQDAVRTRHYSSLASWVNNFIRYNTLDTRLSNEFPDVYRAVYHHGFTTCCGEFMSMYAPNDGRSRGDTNTAEIYTKIVTALATFGPTLNQVVRHYHPELNLPEFVETATTTTSEVVSDVPAWKVGRRDKSKYSYKRKDNYRVSRIFPSKVGKGEQRYDVLNTSNISTVEFRLFKGTMNPGSIFRYLEFVDALTRFVGCTSASNDGIHFTTFINWIIDDSFNVSRYENIVSMLVDKKRIERIQVRRKTLAELSAKDGNILEGLVAKKRDVKLPTSVPLYTITANPGAPIPLETVNPTFVPEEYDPENDEYPDNDEDDEGCDCDDCCRSRGEDI